VEARRRLSVAFVLFALILLITAPAAAPHAHLGETMNPRRRPGWSIGPVDWMRWLTVFRWRDDSVSFMPTALLDLSAAILPTSVTLDHYRDLSRPAHGPLIF